MYFGNQRTEFDAIVLGASLAGSTAATLLGRAGLRVLLVDKTEFPRDKPCGEGFSQNGIVTATRLGFWNPDSPPVPAQPYRGFRVTSGKIWRELKLNAGHGIAVERKLLDQHWIECAKQTPGVIARMGLRAIPWKNNEQLGITLGSEKIPTRYLVIADGSNSPGARALGCVSKVTGIRRMGASLHFHGRYSAIEFRVHIRIHDNFELYATPLANGALNLAVLAVAGAPLNLRSILLDSKIQDEVFSALRFEGDPISEPIGRSPVGNICRHCSDPRVFLVGDAREEFDPIGGMGMTHAILSAELAATSIKSMEQQGSINNYDRHQNRIARTLRDFTALSYRVLRTSRYFPSLISLANSRLGNGITDQILQPIQEYR